ncbi:MAG: 1-acyl-sn-glycerol-3-phosphate acyltransferase [Deltaproteobacteria bacterium]|nr:1-acyl-sn-glycerol-3-phosphate acyltransferase [Deltaproteobacteria bacterium]
MGDTFWDKAKSFMGDMAVSMEYGLPFPWPGGGQRRTMYMEEFEDIRPFKDSEVTEILGQLLSDTEFLKMVARMRLPRLHRFAAPVAQALVKTRLRGEFKRVNNVNAFQQVVKKYFDKVISGTTSRVSVGGLGQLKRDSAYLFISNHRDIALDPAFVNNALRSSRFDTARIAIGDNLLSKPFASHLMRLNKSFIVNRSARGRQMLLATKKLSRYIRFSLEAENESIWLAQREGRAKNSLDKTEPAIIRMLSMSLNRKTETFGDYIRSLNIVPVSISYEWDPCDLLKATELAHRTSGEAYEKADHEDLNSIGRGITGQKGAVHIHFGNVLDGNYDTPEQVADAVDAQIWKNYVLHPANLVAYEMRYGEVPALPVGAEGSPFLLDRHVDTKKAMEERLLNVPRETHEIFLDIYANPVISRLKVTSNNKENLKTLAS